MHAEPFSYKSAAAELDQIVTSISSGEVDIDTLAESVSRAAQLIRACRQRLRSVELEVQTVLDEMERDLKDPEEDALAVAGADIALERVS